MVVQSANSAFAAADNATKNLVAMAGDPSVQLIEYSTQRRKVINQGDSADGTQREALRDRFHAAENLVVHDEIHPRPHFFRRKFGMQFERARLLIRHAFQAPADETAQAFLARHTKAAFAVVN